MLVKKLSLVFLLAFLLSACDQAKDFIAEMSKKEELDGVDSSAHRQEVMRELRQKLDAQKKAVEEQQQKQAVIVPVVVPKPTPVEKKVVVKKPVVDDIEFALTILPDPADAHIRIMNISPSYYDNIILKHGSYDVLVEKQGFEPWRKWVLLKKNEVLEMTLKKLVVQPVIPVQDDIVDEGFNADLQEDTAAREELEVEETQEMQEVQQDAAKEETKRARMRIFGSF